MRRAVPIRLPKPSFSSLTPPIVPVSENASHTSALPGVCFAIDVEKCGLCGASMILRALLIDAEGSAKFLTRIGEDPNPPLVAPARAPPYFKAPALRRMLGQLDPALESQMKLFGV